MLGLVFIMLAIFGLQPIIMIVSLFQKNWKAAKLALLFWALSFATIVAMFYIEAPVLVYAT